MKINYHIMDHHWGRVGGVPLILLSIRLLRFTYPAWLVPFLDSGFPGIENSGTLFVL